MYYVIKILVTAGLVVAVSEASKRSSLIGGLLAFLPPARFVSWNDLVVSGHRQHGKGR